MIREGGLVIAGSETSAVGVVVRDRH